MKKISVIIPMYYEEDMVTICYKEIKKVFNTLKNYTYEFVFINDGSQDKTLDLLIKIAKKDKQTKVISLSRNFGHQAAISAGLHYVTGNATIIIDADLQDPPKVIPDMIKLWKNGYDIVYGKRKVRKGEAKFKLFTAKLFYKILNHLSDVSIPSDTGDFRLIDKKVVNTINKFNEHNKFMRGLFSYTGFKQIEYLYERDPRYAGKTKYSIKKMIKLATDGIIGFSSKPLKLIFILSIITNIIAIISLISLFIWKKYQTILLINTIITFNTSIILLSIWLLSIYITRIYDEVINRPSYIIESTINIEKTI